MKFRAYLVDDEPLALKRLARLLETTGRFEITGSTTDPAAALEFLLHERVDALFLDIQMPEMTGFELLSRLKEQPFVIFTTAYDAFALKAFEVHSVDYLLKPIEAEQLDRVIQKLDRIAPATPPGLAEQLAAAMQQPAGPDRIATRLGEKISFIDLSRITHFYAEDKLTWAATTTKNYCVDHTIGDLEQRLFPKGFLRIHRATLVNLNWVQEIDSWFAGGVLVRLRDEKRTELQVARDRVRALKDRLGV